MSIDFVSPWQIAETEYDCKHERVSVVRFVDALGRSHVRKQCQRCGAHVGDERKNGYDVEKLPAWNEHLRENWHARKRERAEELRTDFVVQAQNEVDERRAAYRAYLRTPEWQRVKKFVLQRDNYICQGCGCKVIPNAFSGPNRAEVHHKHYYDLNVTEKSWAWECVTLCHKCHREYHGKDQGDDE